MVVRLSTVMVRLHHREQHTPDWVYGPLIVFSTSKGAFMQYDFQRICLSMGMGYGWLMNVST